MSGPRVVSYQRDDLAAAWEMLPGGPVAEHRGEVWEYMETQIGDDGVLHVFRHRCYPATNGREYIGIAEGPTGRRVVVQ